VSTAVDPALLPEDTRRVGLAMALLWTWRPRTAIFTTLGLLGLKRADGRAFTQDDVRQHLRELRARGLLADMPGRDGFHRLTGGIRAPMYRDVLARFPAAALRAALHQLDRFRPDALRYHWPLYDSAATISLLRLELLCGAPEKQLDHWRDMIAQAQDGIAIVMESALLSFDAELHERIVPAWRWRLAHDAAHLVNSQWISQVAPAAEWALGKLAPRPDVLPAPLRLSLGELLLHRGETARALAAIEGLEGGFAEAQRAFALAQGARWDEAAARFESALRLRHEEAHARKRVLPASLAWVYPMALLAGRDPAGMEVARKFCNGEAGKRNPDPWEGWGLWSHAIGVRLGLAPLETSAFLFHSARAPHVALDGLWKLLAAAWLGREAFAPRHGKGIDGGNWGALAAALRERLLACGFAWTAGQATAAATVLAGGDPPRDFFASGSAERWRDVLVALRALGEPTALSGAAEEREPRIFWSLGIGPSGEIESVEPFERKRGPRGWGKPRPLPLSKIAADEHLSAHDARVARAIRQDRYESRRRDIDRAAAVMALIGHPAVVLAGDFEQPVDLVEGAPEVEVVREAEGYRLRVTPALRPAQDEDSLRYASAESRQEAEALRAITLVRDSPRRLRVIRMGPAQRRAAQLLARPLAVPASAHAELQEAVRSLAGHFQVHADHAQAAREVEPDARLRAEIAPAGEALTLRLVVAPLGDDGPRLDPGTGRERLMAAIGGETVGTRRDLAAERAHVEAVLDALPFLADIGDGADSPEWVVAEPDLALEMVERLPQLPAVRAVEWPKGRSVQVVSADARQVAVTIKGERDWFRLDGRATLDEGLVVGFETLLAAARAKSRFVPMGDGVYVALTKSLKERLADVAAVAEAGRHGTRVPRMAAAWVEEALEGASVEADPDFREAIERLHAAMQEAPPVPETLQAQLRPYQEDGYRWAMRLAQAGLGACLADDMGLGKTLQGLAVLLARAAGGPALVVAPTSVCGNWVAESGRFAPTLGVSLYGEGDRDSLLAGAGPGDVIVTSYALLQQAGEKFASRRWHTLIADEAQAIKNAAAKRTIAVYEVPADFRLALSGTPVENRLAELWSIMRFANPGLLGTLPRFNERFAGPIERERDRDARQVLRRIIAPFVLRRVKSQVLRELPPRTELVVSVAPEAAEAAHYEAIRRQAVAEADRALSSAAAGQARLNILAQLMRLRRAACDPRLVSPASGIAGAKVRAFADLAAELVANGHKALVFSQFVDFLQVLRMALEEAGIRYQYLDGATPAGERTRRVAAFQAGEGDLFLISLKAGGFGLNLTAADYVLITDPWWNPAAEDQATGRAHRIGQARPVTVYRLVTRGTVEERIVSLHDEKRSLAESILAEGEAAALPSTAELAALIRG
jgi:superfamily II DNA or RNA helicase